MLVSPSQVVSITLSGTEGTNGFYCLFRKRQAKRGERNCPSFKTTEVVSSPCPDALPHNHRATHCLFVFIFYLFLFCLTSIKINETGKLYMSVKLFVYAIHVEISLFKPNNKILKRNITNVHERFGYNRYDLGYVILAMLSFGYTLL